MPGTLLGGNVRPPAESGQLSDFLSPKDEEAGKCLLNRMLNSALTGKLFVEIKFPTCVHFLAIFPDLLLSMSLCELLLNQSVFEVMVW